VGVRVFRRNDGLPLPQISSDAKLVVWPGVGAEYAGLNHVRMREGERNVAHLHRSSEDTIVILAGSGTVEDLTNDVVHEFGPRHVIHVPPGVEHAVRADRGSPVESAGGPCPPDLDMLRALGLDHSG
jgi:quercetin dioxygenase-like cupin family protein